MRITTWIAAAGLALLAVFVPATASWAQPAQCPQGSANCVDASATVGSMLTMSLATTSFNFGSGQPGTTLGGFAQNGPTAVEYSVTTNDAKGYTVTVAATNFSSAIPATDLTTENGLLGGQMSSPIAITGAGQPVTLTTTSAPSGDGGDGLVSAWELALPGNAPAGTYGTQLTYTAIGN